MEASKAMDNSALVRSEGFPPVAERRRLAYEKDRLRTVRSLGTLAGAMAHELNNLMAVILGTTSLVRFRCKADPDLDGLLGNIEGAGQRAADLAMRLLTFADGGAPVCRPVDVGAIVARAVATVFPEDMDTRHLFSKDGPVLVRADAAQIHTSLVNVLTNARQASSGRGDVDVTVGIETVRKPDAPCLPAGRYVQVSVRDTGPGMAAPVLSRAREPFFTTREGAFGLGLTVSDSILRRHGGALCIDSRPGRGTTVRFLLPLHSDDQGAVPAALQDAP